MNPKFSIVVNKYKYTCGKCDYTAFLLPFLRQMYLRYRSATQKFCSFFFYCTHMHNIAFLAYAFLSVFPIYIWCVLDNFPHQPKTCPKKSANFYCWCAFCTLISILTEGLKRFIPNFPAQIFTKSYFPSDCLVQILFFWFFADESQSHCIESNFPYQKISTFQFLFYLFRILSK